MQQYSSGNKNLYKAIHIHYTETRMNKTFRNKRIILNTININSQTVGVSTS